MTNMPPTLSLVVRRVIRATPERLFDAWTRPEQLMQWWGPAGVECSAAEIDLRVGGTYRIGNRFPDGNVVWISGEFDTIDPPRKLVYSWRVDDALVPERVSVRFEPRSDGTEVIIVHERIADSAARDLHEHGWAGCLDGLNAFV